MNPLLEVISASAAMADWVGEGAVPVDQMVAEFRASRCMSGNNGDPCPLNGAENWWDWAKHVVAMWIRRELEIKNELNLSVKDEQRLHMCKACGCCLRLKVWVPIKHLREHTSTEQLNKMPDYCWMKRDLS